MVKKYYNRRTGKWQTAEELKAAKQRLLKVLRDGTWRKRRDKNG